jgi:tripartite-type tricarboxylate transporter receptor subunit TctC
MPSQAVRSQWVMSAWQQSASLSGAGRFRRRAAISASAHRTPAGIIDKLNKEVNAGFAELKLKTQLADLGGIILGGSSADFRRLISEETEKWGKVIRAANIKPE